MKLDFDNRYAQLPGAFYTKMKGEGFAKDPFVIDVNDDVADEIGLGDCKDLAHYFCGNREVLGSESLAMAYSGHQFGVWAGRLGDGRALLLGQVRDKNGDLLDVQLKGSGKTPYSRMGDGRAVLRSCVREYLASQALNGLGIAATRGLCLVGTGEFAVREAVEPAVVMTRVARTHIRFGHFEHFFYLEDYENLRILTDFVIENYFSKIDLKDDLRYEKFFTKVVELTAKMIANWQAVGFCHGVMNTDNMSIVGETIDFGPFGFMEKFDQNFICNKSDYEGRYAFNRQPSIGLWNLRALGVALSPLLDMKKSSEILTIFESVLQEEYLKASYKKLGFVGFDDEKNALISRLFVILDKSEVDLTSVYRKLAFVFEDESAWLELFGAKSDAREWLRDYKKNVDEQGFVEKMKLVNPKFVLRNWVAEKVIRKCEDEGDYSLLRDVLAVLRDPFKEHEKFDELSGLAPEGFGVVSVSCSS